MLGLDLGKAVEAVKQSKAKIVAVQIPEGLKERATEIAAEIERAGATTFTFIDPCYGSCDLADSEAKALGAELLLHFGHAPFLEKASVKTVYVPLHYDVGKTAMATLASRLSKELGKRESVALCSTIQYTHLLGEFGKLLEKNGLRVFVGEGKGVERGQVLGCNYSSVKSVEAKVQAVVFFGDGLFHALGISFCCKKPVFIANPLSGEAKELKGERRLFLKKRYAAIASAMKAESFGILLSSKKGQLRKALALELKKKLESRGRKAFLLVGDFIRAEYVLGIKVDALVSTACPRIAFDDYSLFRQPLLSPAELLIALGEKKFGEYDIGEFL